MQRMGGWWLSAGVCWLASFAAQAWGADGVTISANPGRFGTIEQAAEAEKQVDWWDADTADDNACTECFAATELKRFLVACGWPEADVRLAAEAMPASGEVLLIGSGASNSLTRAVPDTVPAVAAEEEAYRVRAVEAGGRTVTVIRGRDRVGTLYGVYAYLEHIGVRFYGLGDRDTLLPRRPVELPQKLDLSGAPDYLTRGFHAWEDRGDRPFFLWMARNRLNYWCTASSDPHFLKKLGMRLIAGQHNIQYRCLNPKTYFEKHPEWYGLRGGKRSPKISEDGFGDNYCTSNAEATAELAKNLVQECIDGEYRSADLLNFWMLDNGKWCECEACRQQGTYTDRLLSITHAVRKAIVAARKEGRLKRDVQVVTLAYHETLPPPSKPLPPDFDYANCFVTWFPIERCFVHAMGDPACTEVNEALRASLEGWTTGAGRHYTGSIFIGEYYNVSSFKSLPLLFTRSMAADIPWYYRTGARHFHYMHTPTAMWGTWRLNQYLMARLLWDVNAKADAIVDEYFARTYPTATLNAKEFYRELEQAMANGKAFKHYIYVGGKQYSLRGALLSDKSPLFPHDHLHYEVHRPLLNDGPDVVEIVAGMGRARQAIDAALINCRGAAERDRLIEDERRFAYGEATVDFYHRLVRTAMFHRAGDAEQARREFALADRAAEILRGMVDVVQVSSSHANAKDGLDATQAGSGLEYYRKIYAATQPAGAK